MQATSKMSASQNQISASLKTPTSPTTEILPTFPEKNLSNATVLTTTVLNPRPIQKLQPIQNRVQVLLVHIPKFSIQGQARLAADVGVSRSTISRLVHGRINPSYRLARGVTDALERMLRKPLDMREVFSTNGTYLTPSGCVLCQCGGCLPDRAYDPEGNLRPEWHGQRPGDWSLTGLDSPGPTTPCPIAPTVSADAGHKGIADAGKEAQ